MAMRGTAELLDSSVGVEVTRHLTIVRYWNSTRSVCRENRHPANRFELKCTNQRKTTNRIVQQALLDILQPILDPDFYPSRYGYRPGRSCQQAVAISTMFIRRYGLVQIVDMDLSRFFDQSS